MVMLSIAAGKGDTLVCGLACRGAGSFSCWLWPAVVLAGLACLPAVIASGSAGFMLIAASVNAEKCIKLQRAPQTDKKSMSIL